MASLNNDDSFLSVEAETDFGGDDTVQGFSPSNLRKQFEVRLKTFQKSAQLVCKGVGKAMSEFQSA